MSEKKAFVSGELLTMGKGTALVSRRVGCMRRRSSLDATRRSTINRYELSAPSSSSSSINHCRIKITNVKAAEKTDRRCYAGNPISAKYAVRIDIEKNSATFAGSTS